MNKVLFLSLAVAVPAAAQTTTFGWVWPNDGLALPPQSVATASEATAPAYNPAALGCVRDGQLFYFHQGQIEDDRTADGVYSGFALGPLKLGLAMEWVRDGGLRPRRRTAWTAALHEDRTGLCAGLTYNAWSSNDHQVADFDGVDVGAAYRPLRWLSVGFAARGLGAPAFTPSSSGNVPARFQVGVGVRPFGEWLTLAVDQRWESDFFDFGEGRELMYTAEVIPVPGVRLQLGLAQIIGDGHTTFLGQPLPKGPWLQAALIIDTAHAGATYSQLADPGTPQRSAWSGGVRFSGERYPSVYERGRRVWVFDVEDALRPASLSVADLLGGARGLDPFSRLVLALHQAARDPKASAIVIRFGASPLGFARAEEIRNALQVAREGGKKIVAYLELADDALYYAASGAHAIWAAPHAEMAVNGLALEYLFFGGTLEKIGVRVEYARVGRYKTFPEMLTREDLSDAQSEVAESILDDLEGRYFDALSEGRGLGRQSARAVLALGLQSSVQARKSGLVDRVMYPDEVEDALSEVLEPGYSLARAQFGWPQRQRWGRRPQIAVIRVEGTIAPGPSQRDPLGLSTVAGADTITQLVRAAAEDKAVEAIVIRVDSGGGDGLASDLIWREVYRARSKKPVIASMGSTAASGGYYVAAGADTILADPSTITGSIGVFMLKADLAGLYEKLGVGTAVIKRGERADLLSSARGWTDADSELAQRFIEELYDTFVSRVAESRKLEKSAVDAMARGRVWTGTQALERKLVDRLGGLYDAVALARERAGYADDADVDVVAYSARGGDAGLDDVAARLPPELVQALRAAGADVLAAGGGVLTMMPYRIEVR